MPYKATCEGQYIYRNGTKKEVAFYEDITVEISDKQEEKALSVIRKSLIDDAIRLKHKDCVEHRTCSIKDIEHIKESNNELPEDVNEMTKEQVKLFCKQNDIPINVGAFGRVADARKAVLNYLADCAGTIEEEEDETVDTF